jgi:hypothetical protein
MVKYLVDLKLKKSKAKIDSLVLEEWLMLNISSCLSTQVMVQHTI